MKIKKPTTHTHPSSHVRQITAHLHKLPDTQLLQELPKHTCTLKQWRESKREKTPLLQWYKLLNRFDSIMARCIPQAPAVVPSTTQTSESSSTPVLEIARFSNEEERLLVWHILEFTRELLHCSTSNNFYASHDRLQSLLLCDDDEIVVEALCVLGQLLADPHSVVHTNAALSQVLSELARGWGGKQNCAPLGLFLSVEAPNDVPESVTTLHLEFLKTPEKTASSSPSPKVTIIHIPKLHQLQETSLSIFNATVARFAVPPQLHIPLYIRIRFIKSSAKKQSLLMWALIRLLAKNTLLCGRFARSAEDIEVVDEMADVLKCGPIEGLNGRGESYLSMLRVMCLRLMTVLCTEAAQNGQSFLEQILTACGCNAHNGLLPSLIRKSVSLIVASTTTSVQDPLFNADFIFELFKFVRAIAENTAGAQALHLSGSFSSMAPLIRVQTIDFYSLLPQICSIFETWLSSKHSNAATLHDIGFIEDLISRISVELKGLLTQPLPFTGIPAAEAATSAETATSLSGTEGTSTERGQPTPSKDIFCSPKATKAVIQSMFRVLLLMLPQSLMSIVQAEELPTLLAIVFKNPQVLGDRLLCLASKTFSRILNEEPTAYATLESLEVPKSFLSVLSSPDFPQYPWFMSVVPSVISALCLSKKALTGILEAHCVEEFFEKMISPKVVVSMDSRTVSRLSLGLADLSRHYSEFKPLVSQVCLTILGRVTKIAEDVASGAPQREQEERERKAQYKRDKEKVSSCASTVSNEPAKDLNTVPPVSSTSSTVSTSVKEGDNETTSIYQHRQASKKGVTGCHYCGKDRSGAICGPISGPNCEKCQLIDVEEGIIPYDQQVQTCDTPAFLWVFSSFSSCLLEGIFSVQENASSFINNGGVVALTKLAGTPFPPIFFSQNQAHPALFDNVFHCLVTRAPQILQGVIASLHQTFELLSKTVVGWENGTLYFHKILPQVEPPLAMINHTTNILNGLLHDSYGNKALQLMSEWVTPIGTEVFSKLGLLQRLLFSDMSAFKLEHKRADYPPILSLSGLALHALSSALSLALTIPVGRHQNDKPLHTLSLGFSKTWCNHLSWANQVPEASRHGYLRYVLEALKLMLFDDRHKTHTLFLYHLRRAGFFTLLSEQLSWAINYEGSEKQGKQRTKTLCSFADLFQRTMDKESVMSAEVTAQMLTQKLPDLTGSFDPHEFVSSVQGELSSIVYTVWGGGSVIEKHLPPALAALAFESIKFHLMQEMEESKVKLQTKDKSKSAFPETVITQLQELGFTREHILQAWKVLPKGTSIPRITDWLLNNPPEVKEDDDLAAAIAMSLVSVTPASSTTAPSAPYTGPPIPEEELIGMDDEELAMALSLSQEQPPGASSETPIKLSSSTNPPPIVPLPSIQETSTTTTTPSTATSSTVTASTTSSADVLPLTNPRYILNALLDLLRQNYDIASVFSSVVDIFITIAKRSNEDSVSVLSLLLEALQPNPDPVPESTSAQLQETSTVLLLLTSLLPSLREVFDTAPHLYTKTLSVVQSLVEYTLPKDTDVEDIKLLASKWAAFGAALRVLDAIVSGATVDISLATQLLTSSITALRKSILNSYASRCALILIARLTMDYDVACKFVQIGGVEALLNCTVFSTTEPKHVSACAFHALTIIRHVLEDPQFLQTTMESHIKSSLSARVPIQQFLEQMAPLCLRNKPIFLASVRNLCELDRSGGIKLRPLKAGLAPSSTSATEIHSPTSVPVITNSPTQSSSSVQSSDTAPNISGDSKPQENAVSTEKLSEEKKPDDMSTDKSKASELQSQIIAQFISRVQTSLGSTKTDAESRKITPLFNFTKVLELLYEILKSSNSLVDTLLHCSGATFLHKLLDEVLQQIDERALAVTTPLLSTLCSTEQGCKCVAQEISSFLEGEITGMEYGSMVLPTRLFKLIEICNYLFTLPPQFSNILLEFLVKGKAISLLTVALDKLEPSVCGTTTLVQSIVHVMEVLVRNTLYKPNPPVAPTSTSAATGASLYSLLSAGGRPPPSANTFRDILSAELSSGSNSWNTVEFDPEGISNTAGLRISSREYNRFGGPRLINDARLPVLQPFEPLEVPVNPSIPTFTSTPSASASTSASTTPSLAPVRLESAALPSGEAAMEVDASSRFPEISSIIRHLEMDADGLSSDAGARGTDEDENEEDEDDEDEENNDGENQSAAEGNESPVSDYEDEEDNSVESSLSAILDPLQQSRVPSWTRMPRSSSPLAARMMEETALLRRLHTLERGVNMLASEELRIQRTSQPQLTRASMWTADGSAPTERQIRDLQSLEAEIITAVQVTQPSMEIKDSSKAPQPLPSDITSMWTEALAQVSRGSSPPPQHLTSDTSAPELRTPTTSNIPQLSVRTPTESGTSTNSLMEALHASLEQIFASNTTNSQSQLASGSQTSSPISPAQVTEVPTPIPPVVIPAPIPPTPAINQAAPNVLSPAPVPEVVSTEKESSVISQPSVVDSTPTTPSNPPTLAVQSPPTIPGDGAVPVTQSTTSTPLTSTPAPEIDPTFLQALPPEIQDEVLASRLSRPAPPPSLPQTSTIIPGTDPSVLAQLPPDIQAELLEDQERLLREAQPADPRNATEMNLADFIATLTPDLREEVLLTVDDSVLETLPPAVAAEAHLVRERAANSYTSRIDRMYSALNPPPSSGLHSRISHAHSTTSTKTALQHASNVEEATFISTRQLSIILRLLYLECADKLPCGRLLSYLCSVPYLEDPVIAGLLTILTSGLHQHSKPTLDPVISILEPPQPKSLDQVLRESEALAISPQLSNHFSPLEHPIHPLIIEYSNAQFKLVSSHPPAKTVQLIVGYLSNLAKSNSHVCEMLLSNKEEQGVLSSLLRLLSVPPFVSSSDQTSKLVELLELATKPISVHLRNTEAPGSDATPDPEKTAPPLPTNGATQDPMAAPETTTTPATPKPLPCPQVDSESLGCLVKVISLECTEQTYRYTNRCIKRLAQHPENLIVLCNEMVETSQKMLQSVVNHLSELHLKLNTPGLNPAAVIAMFSMASTPAQNLLRLIRTLISLSPQKEMLLSKGGKLHLQPLWDEMFGCLNLLEVAPEKKSAAAPASVSEVVSSLKKTSKEKQSSPAASLLLPIIQMFFVVSSSILGERNSKPASSISKLRSSSSTQTQVTTTSTTSSSASSPVSASVPSTDSNSDMQAFHSFVEKYRALLNDLIRHNSALLGGAFSLMVTHTPRMIDFDNKCVYFRSKLQELKEEHESLPPLVLHVSRDKIFEESFHQLRMRKAPELKGRLSVRFQGEEGIDAGGLTKEWYQVISKEMFNPLYGLFRATADRAFQPNILSNVNPDHLDYFKFVGRVVGKALHDGHQLDAHFTRSFYKHILGQEVSLKDMECVDHQLYKTLLWVLQNNVTDTPEIYFTSDHDAFGRPQQHELKPGGKNTLVTNENKHEYIKLYVEHRLTGSIQNQINNFLAGFHDLIPAQLISIFTETELELLISGLPDINIDDLRTHTEYHGYTSESPQIHWFWQVVQDFGQQERAQLLQFVTGSSKVPLEGFKALSGMFGNGFKIHKAYRTEGLPTAHTCYNQLDLPEYQTYEILKEKLLLAVREGCEGFGFA